MEDNNKNSVLDFDLDEIKAGLDKVVDGLVDASNGKMPEGFDPSQFKF